MYAYLNTLDQKKDVYHVKQDFSGGGGKEVWSKNDPMIKEF